MDYPTRVAFSALQSTHHLYDQLVPVWETIDDLSNGGHQLESKKEKYVKIRPGEDLLFYRKRLERFTYANILSSALNEQTAKLNLGTLLIEGQEENPDFWSTFLNKIDKKSNYWDFAIDLFRTLLQYKFAYLRINKPVTDEEIETQLDAENLDSIPYTELVKPQFVINWSDQDEDGFFDWVKLRYLKHEVSQFGVTQLIANWVFIDKEAIATYRCAVKLVNGRILPVLTPEQILADPDGEVKVALASEPIKHGFGVVPIQRVEIPDYLWLADQAYLKCLEHLNVDNSRYDALMTIGYVQRTYQPQESQQPDDSMDYTKVNARLRGQEDDKFYSGNPYILKVSEFKFNEAGGSSVAIQATELERLERQIKDILGLSGYTAQKGEMEQSRVSKDFDLIVQEISLRRYGRYILKAMNWILQVAAIAKGSPNSQVTAIGLDKFKLDALPDLVEILALLEPFEDRIAPTALRLFYSEIQSQMVRNIDVETSQQIDVETQSIWRNYSPDLGTDVQVDN